MKFLLFSGRAFEVSQPVALIESYCFQSDFYTNYDLLLIRPAKRTVEDVNKIGARMTKESLEKCKAVTEKTQDLCMFRYDLDRFLELDDETKNGPIKELNEKVIEKLLKIERVGLSKATKVLHTLHPEIIPMIDDALQKEYRNKVNPQWTEKQSTQILIDYYNNLTNGNNWENLTDIFNQTRCHKLVGLTKVRIFDILWCSYLKAKSLRHEENIDWSTIKW